MKILLWSNLYFPNIGGLEKMAHSLAKGLTSKGHKVLVIANLIKEKHFTIDTIEVFAFPFLHALFQYQIAEIGRTIKEISHLIDEFSPDIVNIHGWHESFSFYQIRVLEKRKIPVCLTVHGLLEQNRYDTEHCVRLWKRAQSVNVVSYALPSYLPHPSFHVIYNGLFPSQKPVAPLPQNRLLLIGRLSPEKCFHVAFHALKLLLPRHPDLQMTLLGDGPEYKHLLDLKESFNLPIQMPGFVQPHEVTKFIDESTMVLVPSSYESFCLAAVEAAFRGRPVVASRVMALKEVIEEGKTGLLVDPQDPRQLADAIETLLLNPDRMEQMGKEALQRANNLFHIDITVNKYLSMYEQATHLCYHPGS